MNQQNILKTTVFATYFVFKCTTRK